MCETVLLLQVTSMAAAMPGAFLGYVVINETAAQRAAGMHQLLRLAPATARCPPFIKILAPDAGIEDSNLVSHLCVTQRTPAIETG